MPQVVDLRKRIANLRGDTYQRAQLAQAHEELADVYRDWVVNRLGFNRTKASQGFFITPNTFKTLPTEEFKRSQDARSLWETADTHEREARRVRGLPP